MADRDAPPAPLSVGAAMTRITTAVGERIIGARLATGLTSSQLQALRLAVDGSRMSALATSLGLSKSTLTSVVNQLVAAELALRVADPADRRLQVVRLTDAGRDVLESFDAEVTGAAGAMLDGMSVDERNRLTELLSRLPSPTRPIPLA